MACIGGILEGRAGFARLELARSLAVAAFLVLAGRWFGVDALPPSAWFAMGAAAIGSALGAWLAVRSLAMPAPPAGIAASR